MNNDQFFESFLPLYDDVPDDWEDARAYLTENLKKIAEAINHREIGFFLDEEVLTGKEFIPGSLDPIGNPNATDSQEFRSILRKVINFGPLPNAGTKTSPHGITFDFEFTLISFWAAATDPVAFKAFQIPYASPTLNKNIQLDMDNTNVTITTAINYSSFTRCFVMIEYIQEL
jgi:hypothetical protein